MGRTFCCFREANRNTREARARTIAQNNKVTLKKGAGERHSAKPVTPRDKCAKDAQTKKLIGREVSGQEAS